MRQHLFEGLEPRRLMATFTVANLNDTGAGSLRQAVTDADNAAGADVIDFQAGLTGTITLASGPLLISDGLTINGPGAGRLTISGIGASRGFMIDGGVIASFSGLTIGNMFTAGNGAAIENFGTLTLNSVILSNNSAQNGAAIWNNGWLTIVNSTLSDNAANSSGGAVSISGGVATVTGCTISGNTAIAGNGGGINVTVGACSISDSIVYANHAANHGGGVANTGSGTLSIVGSAITANTCFGVGAGVYSTATLAMTTSTVSLHSTAGSGAGMYLAGSATLVASTFSGNTSTASGGGVFVLSGTVTITNVTICANTAAAGQGGGLHIAGGAVTVRNSTIASNTGSGGIFLADGTTTLVSSIVAGNTGGDILNDKLAAGSTNNLVQDGVHEGGLVHGVGGNLVGVDPLLGGLASNGGPTKTKALLAGSPAIGKGLNPANLTTDQRGGLFARGVSVDIGAYQRQSFALVVDTVVDEDDGNYAPGDLSLREAIGAAGPNPGNDTISFAAALNGGTIVLGGTHLSISGDVSINGPGASVLSISGNHLSRVFFVASSANVSISGLTVKDGQVTGMLPPSGGGGILNTGTLSITNSTISGNSAEDSFGGGGICSTGTLTITNSTISGNLGTSSWGAGIYNNFGALTITNSTISGNTAQPGVGGGVYNSSGALTITNSTISGNLAQAGGGGVYNSHGPLTITGSKISDNSSGEGAAGGVNAGVSSATITNSTISGNLAQAGGGGVYATGDLAITGSTISGNSAPAGRGGGVYSTGGALTIGSSTISDNSSQGPGGGVYATGSPVTIRNSTIASNLGGGGIYSLGGATTLVSSIVSGNTGGDIQGALAAGSTNNLVQSPFSSGGLSHGVNGNLVGVDPLLGALADHGGPTKTMALLGGSPAINKGSNPGSIVTDQRGQPRVRGAAIDIGAYEFSAAPVVSSLTPSASSVIRGQSITFTASVSDADGTVAAVHFYADLNNNGVLNPGEPELSPFDTDGANGYSLTLANTTGLALGAYSVLAQGVDNDGQVGNYGVGATTILNHLPVAGVLTPSKFILARTGSLTLTLGATDADGAVASVSFYRDANTDGVADPGELMGTDSNGADGFSFVFNSTSGTALGVVWFLAFATDNDAGVSPVQSVSVTVTNSLPTIQSLTPSPGTIENGDPLTLTAGVVDFDGAVASVSFYADTNNNGSAEPSELLGTDSDSSGGFTLTLTPAQTFALPSGVLTFIARATDDLAASSPPRSAGATLTLAAADQFIQTYNAAPKSDVGLVDGDAIATTLQNGVSNVATSDAYWGARNLWFQDKHGDVWSLWQGGDVHLSKTLAGQHEWVLTNLTDAAGLSGSMHFAPGSLSGITTGWNAFNIQGIQDGKLSALWWSPAGSAGTYIDTDGSPKQGGGWGVRGNGWSLSSISDAATSIGGAVASPPAAFLAYSQSQGNGRTEFDPRASFVTANTGMSVVVVDVNHHVFAITFSVSQRPIAGANISLNGAWIIEPLAEVPSIADFGLGAQEAAFEQAYVTAATK